MKNMMVEFLKDDYSNNSIINFLNYWMKNTGKRESSDLDCLYYNGDLRADTLFSVWTPLKWVIDCLKSDKNEKFYKENKYGGDKYFYIKKIKTNISILLPDNDLLVQELYKFVKLAETRANYFLWPKTGVNGLRYNDSYDEVPNMLYNCFTNPQYQKCFDYDDNKMKQWIENEHLEVLFDGEVSINNIKPLIEGVPVHKAKWLNEYAEILKTLKNYNKVLEDRYNILLCETAPF